MGNINEEELEMVMGPLLEKMKQAQPEVNLPPTDVVFLHQLVEVRAVHLLKKTVLNSSEISLLSALLNYKEG